MPASDAAVGHQHQRQQQQQHLRAARCISAAGGGSKCAREEEGEADDVKSFKLFRSATRDRRRGALFIPVLFPGGARLRSRMSVICVF